MLLFSFVGVVNFVCILDYRNYLTYSVYLTSWTDSERESLITFYSSVLVSGAINFAIDVKNRRQKPAPVFWRQFLERVSLA